MTDKKICRTPGCGKEVKAKGLCGACYMSVRRKEKKISKVESKERKDDLISKILGPRTVMKTPPDVPKEQKTDEKSTETKPTTGKTETAPTGSFPVKGSFFRMIGHRLAKGLDTKEFELDEQEADYLAECLQAMLREKGTEVSPTTMFIFAIASWLGLGFLTFFVEKDPLKLKDKEMFKNFVDSKDDKEGLRWRKSEVPTEITTSQIQSPTEKETQVKQTIPVPEIPTTKKEDKTVYYDLMKMQAESLRTEMTRKPDTKVQGISQ